MKASGRSSVKPEHQSDGAAKPFIQRAVHAVNNASEGVQPFAK